MNFDYTEIIKSMNNDKVCYNYLQHVASYHSGIDKFNLKGLNNIEVFINENTSEIKLKANLPYYWQGHNFTFTKASFIESLKHTSDLIGINLFMAEVKTFEFGTIIETRHNPEEVLSNHISYNGKPLQPYYSKGKLTGKYYEAGPYKLKLYDAGRNIKNKLPEPIRCDLSNLYGYDRNKHYLKVENHYKKPEIQFKKRQLLVNEVLSDSFMILCKNHLIESYMNISKTGIIKLPESKKDINSSTLPLIVIHEMATLLNFDAKQLLFNKLKSIPESTLSKEDKKARKRQLQANFNKIELANKSEYDLCEYLKSKEII